MAPRTTPAALAAPSRPRGPRSAWHAAGFALSLALAGCKDAPLPAPDPQGDDLVAGAVVAAVTTNEPTPGVRTYKIVHVQNFPPPMTRRLDMVAYDPKAPTFDDARRAWKAGGMKVVMEHVEVQLPLFMTRDHRVIAVEPPAAGDGGT